MTASRRPILIAGAAEPVDAIGAAEFAGLMAALGPFEKHPVLAVAVSGGPDSLALTLLADQWARERGGSVQAVTVDHAIRAEAAAEASQVASWLAARGIAHVTLRVEQPLPMADLQAAAREARYALIEQYCAERSILHLLVAHHREDQAETFLLRLARGSGVDGLAAMAPVAWRRDLRLLRPLLDEPRARLAATCQAFGQSSIDDPSNRNLAFRRARLRSAAAILGEAGLTSARLADTAGHMARARIALEGEVARLLARAVSVHPAGFANLDAGLLGAAPEETGLRALAALLGMIGGAAYPPRFERTRLLHAQLVSGEVLDRTLGGCRIIRKAGANVLILRELAAIGPDIELGSDFVRWDNRFRLRLMAEPPDRLTVAALGPAGVAELAKSGALKHLQALPRVVLPTLPCVRRLEELCEVPHLNYCRTAGTADTMTLIEVVPDPENACTGP